MESIRKRTTYPRTFSPLNLTLLWLHVAVLFTGLPQASRVSAAMTPLDEKGIQISHAFGRDAEMTCTVKDLGARRIIWSKLSDPYPISVGNTRFNTRHKYKVNVTDNKSVLTIKNVKLEDAGEYQCRASGQVYLAETLTLNIQAGEDSTYLLTSETEISAEVGGTALLPCLVENIKQHLVLWKKGHNDVLTLRRKVYNGDHRLTVLHNTRPEWSLQIKNVRKSDFGMYTCIINSEPLLTRTVRLNDATPAQFAPLLIQDSSFKRRVEVNSGETVTLSCNFKASPPAKVTWYQRITVDGKTVKKDLGQGKNYILQSVSPEQSGQYLCEGNNGINPPGRGKTQLNVLAPPTAAPVLQLTTFMAKVPTAPVLYPKETQVQGRLGDNAELKCTAIGNPRPEVYWKRHGVRTKQDYKTSTTNQISRNDTMISVLLVGSLLNSDLGVYECVGRNMLGYHAIPITIYL